MNTPRNIQAKINEQGKLGFAYDLFVATDEMLKQAVEELLKMKVDIADIKNGRLAKEVLQALDFWGGEICQRTASVHNLVPNFLRYEFVKQIIGQSITPTWDTNYIALGDDATAVAYTDTVMGNETNRATFDARSTGFNIAYLDKFFGSSVVGGNSYYEIGLFVDGSAGADTGYLFSHVNISEVMAANESLTVNAKFTITDS